jgi:hypothetical protein
MDAKQSLPTRLINVEGEEPVLVATSSLGAGSVNAYCAVSYCWGNEPKSEPRVCGKLVTPNARAALQISTAVARAKGIFWLWMDSVCIHQDDDSDKAREMGCMGKYYNGASLCVAVVENLTKKVCQEMENFCARNGRGSSMSLVALANELDRSAWIHRCWTLQEALQPKKLLFTSTDIVNGLEEGYSWWGIDSLDLLLAMQYSGDFLSALNNSRAMSLAAQRMVMDVPLQGNMYGGVLRWVWEIQFRQCDRQEDQMYCLLGLVSTNRVAQVKIGASLAEAFEKLKQTALEHGDGSILGASVLERSVPNLRVLPTEDCLISFKVEFEDEHVTIQEGVVFPWDDLCARVSFESVPENFILLRGEQLDGGRNIRLFLHKTTDENKLRDAPLGVFHKVLQSFQEVGVEPLVQECSFGVLIFDSLHKGRLPEANFVVQTGAVESWRWHVLVCSGELEEGKILFPAVWINDVVNMTPGAESLIESLALCGGHKRTARLSICTRTCHAEASSW